MSLLDDCHNCLIKGHESWKSFFSKWELLAKEEENIPENELIDEFVPEEIEEKQLSLVPKVKRAKKKKKKVVRRPISKENTVEDSDNEQLELNLRAIFMDILKANENKWEMFSVLSQTFSQGKIQSSHRLGLSQLALPCNDVKMNLNRTPGNQVISEIRNSNYVLGFYENSNGLQTRFEISAVQRVTNQLMPLHTRTLPFVPQTPRRTSDFQFNFRRLLKSCPSKLFQTSKEFPRNKAIKLDFGHESPVTASYKEPKAMNILEEKTPHNLWSPKRIDGGLNMENSNFLTPKGKSPERKCFTEKIQRKRKRPSKLAFFDCVDESESDDDLTVLRSPVILWKNKKQKTEIEEVKEESDSDCESILDRVKPL